MTTRALDVVIVGAGNAALCSAIAAREMGATVLVLEKGPKKKRGGNSYFTDGAIRIAFDSLDDLRKLIPAMTDQQAERIVMPPYTAEQYRADFQRITQGQTDTTLSNTLIDNSFETMRWLQKKGLEFDLIYDNQAFIKDGKYYFWGGLVVKSVGRGIGLINRLNDIAAEMGVEIWYQSAGTQLSQDEAGKINGIYVTRNGQTELISARAVVLACGSYEGSMKKRITQMGPEWEKAILRGTEYNTGDGIDMAVAVGAIKYGDWKMGHAISTDANAPKVGDFEIPGDIFKKSSYPIGLIINKEGKRFVDEGADFRNYTYAKYGREVLRQTDAMAYHVFDGHVAHFPVTCGLTFAFGGVKTTPKAEVVDAQDRPIPGLYAAGEMVGGLFYYNYPGGSGLTSGAVFGKIAGTNAAAYSLLF